MSGFAYCTINLSRGKKQDLTLFRVVPSTKAFLDCEPNSATMLDQPARRALLITLDEERQERTAVLSEWIECLLTDADTAFLAGADLAALLTALAALETFLRDQVSSVKGGNFASLIENLDVDRETLDDLQELRRFRNRWAHVAEPWDDHDLIIRSNTNEQEREDMAILALRSVGKIFSIVC